MVDDKKPLLRLLGADLFNRLGFKYILEFKDRSYEVFLMNQDFNDFDIKKHNDEAEK